MTASAPAVAATVRLTLPRNPNRDAYAVPAAPEITTTTATARRAPWTIPSTKGSANGFLNSVCIKSPHAPSAAPDDVAAALLRVVEAGPTLRDSTARWFADNAPMLRIDRSLELIERAYAETR